MKTKENNRLILKNRKAYFNYEILDTEIAGIVLSGSEVKSVRKTKVNFTDSYCLFISGELWIRNLHISEYEQTGYVSHDPMRDKKLLMTKKQLLKFKKQFEICPVAAAYSKTRVHPDHEIQYHPAGPLPECIH